MCASGVCSGTIRRTGTRRVSYQCRSHMTKQMEARRRAEIREEAGHVTLPVGLSATCWPEKPYAGR